MIIAVAMLVIGLLFGFFGSLYLQKPIDDVQKTNKSPYSYVIEYYNDDGVDRVGYYITRCGISIYNTNYDSNIGYTPRMFTSDKKQQMFDVINELEQVGGYTKTRFNDA